MLKKARLLTHPPRRAKTRRSAGKAAASEGPKAPSGYVEALSDARTPLSDFFSILLETQETVVYNGQMVRRSSCRLNIGPVGG